MSDVSAGYLSGEFTLVCAGGIPIRVPVVADQMNWHCQPTLVLRECARKLPYKISAAFCKRGHMVASPGSNGQRNRES
jgi:hypothetical protein